MVTSMMNLIAQSALISSGGTSLGANGTTTYSVGQVVYQEKQGALSILKEGVQHRYLITNPVGTNEIKSLGSVSCVYPNPTTDILIVKFVAPTIKELTYRMYDTRGKLLLQGTLTEEENIMNMASYACGSYILVILEKNTKVNTFSIIKR